MQIIEHKVPSDSWPFISRLWQGGLSANSSAFSVPPHLPWLASLWKYLDRGMESQIVWVGRNPRQPVPVPCHGQGHLPLRAPPFNLAVTTCVFSTLCSGRRCGCLLQVCLSVAPLRGKEQFHTTPLPLILCLPSRKPLPPQSTGDFGHECLQCNTSCCIFSVSISICKAPVFNTSIDKTQVVFSPVSPVSC